MSSNSVICPYCASENEIDLSTFEGDREIDVECVQCEEEFEVHVDFIPVFNAVKIEYTKCVVCEKEFRRVAIGRYPVPKKYEHLSTEDYDKVCPACYARELSKDLTGAIEL